MDSTEAVRGLVNDPARFSRALMPGYTLREYQLEPLRAIVESVRNNLGHSFAIVFSRQSGKDEMVAQLMAYLLLLYQRRGGTLVLAAPTQRQANISRTRLLNRLQHPLASNRAASGYIVRQGLAEARFLSAAPSANVRGETASLLLIANESQDIEPERWQTVFDPMTASTNATTVFLGTPWTANTLLARQMRYLHALEAQDGVQRVFKIDWQTVGQYLPAYERKVTAKLAQFGRQHPFIKTEYFLEELDDTGGLFPADRLALMHGSHSRQTAATPGRTYCLLVDVGGGQVTGDGYQVSEDRSGVGYQVSGDERQEGETITQNFFPNTRNPTPDTRRDSTAVTVVEVEARAGQMPLYRVVQRYLWTGLPQTEQLARLVTLAKETWRAKYVAIDATGLGLGLTNFLQAALGTRAVVPVVFSAKTKSEVGWAFLQAIDSGRYLEYGDDGAPDTALFWRQVAACQYEVLPGPAHTLRWGVPSQTLHDDLLLSAALVAALDKQNFAPRVATGLG